MNSPTDDSPIPEPEKLGKLDSLNQITPAIIERARQFHDHKAAELIKRYLRPDRRYFVDAFVQEVVRGDVPPEAWARGRIWVIAWSFTDQLTLPLAQLMTPVGGMTHFRVVPSITDWNLGPSWVGAPCKPMPNIDYLTPTPDHALSLKANCDAIESVANPVVAARRWIAVRIAGCTTKKIGTDFMKAAEVAAAYAPLSSWTEDARLALRGLEREAQEFGGELDLPPGFRGPDDWFLEEKR